jgi:O-antigen ligase
MIRVNSIQQGIDTVVNNPFGKGIGSAGPASFYTQKPLIVENWYLQIAIEIGIIGLLIYAVFIVLNLKKLYITSKQKDNSVLSTTLFAAICGILVTSLFLHTLADSTLSILLFGLLGITIGMKSKELVK